MIRPIAPEELEKFVDLTLLHSKDSGMDHDAINRTYLRKQLRQMLIETNYQIFVAEQNNRFVGYAIGAIHEKFYNAKLYGELLYIFIDPSVRNKLLLDDLFARMETWFLDNNCLFMQASVMAYTDEWACQEQYVDKARDYFFKRGKMKEVGYHYIKPIGRDSWAE